MKLSSYYLIAKTHHRNHKGEKLSIPPQSFSYDMYNSTARKIVVRKSTQCGVSELMTVRALCRALMGKSILYVMPTFELKNKFVRERFDRALLYSPGYQSIMKNAPAKSAESMSMKQIGKGTIYFVGSNSEGSFVSVPADDIMIDEVDNCDQKNLVMAEERQSASTDKMSFKVGNPTITGFGIDYEYNKSTRGRWFIQCPSCKAWINPDFFKHVVQEVESGLYIIRDESYQEGKGKDINLICQCGKPLNRFAKGKWVHEGKSDIEGFTVSKLFSTQVTVKEIVDRFNEGLANESVMQRVYNGDLGLAYTAKGAKVDRDMILDCVDKELLQPYSGGPTIAGIDVGSTNHTVIAEITTDNRLKLVFWGAVQADDAESLVDVLKRFNVRFFVIDAMPETRFSKRILALMKGRGLMNFYGNEKTDVSNPRAGYITSARTQALDAVKESLLLQHVVFPAAIANDKDFIDQMTCSTRVYDDEKDKYDWIATAADHYFHAFAYLCLARKMMVAGR